jgi:uncharacterized protein
VTVVSNTGPLIVLAKVDQFKILKQLAGAVFITPEVEVELMAKRGFETSVIEDAFTDFLVVKKASPAPKLAPELEGLDAGESSAIYLAQELGADSLLMDDRAGVKVARKLGLTVLGFAGFVVTAKRLGAVSAVKPILEKARRHGYWIADEILSASIELAGE